MRRDVGAAVALPRWLSLPERADAPERALPVNAWSLRSVYKRSLATIAAPPFWWTLAIAGFAALMVFIVGQTEEQLRKLYEARRSCASLIGNVERGPCQLPTPRCLSFLFVFLPVLLMAFAVTQASRWAADEEDGLQELVLATPQPRLTVILARFGALTTATVIIGVVTLALTALPALISGLALDWGNLARRIAFDDSAGAADRGRWAISSLAGCAPAIDTGLLSFLLVIWFVITFIGPELNWSDGVLRLSPSTTMAHR